MAAGVDVNTVDKMKRTALWLAVDENRVKVVEELCQAGADINLAGPDGRSPLHIAARKGLNDCAAILLNHGAETDNNPDRFGRVAADDCAVSMTRILIEEAQKERRANLACMHQPVAPSAPPEHEVLGYPSQDGKGPSALPTSASKDFAYSKAGWDEEATCPLDVKGKDSVHTGEIPPSYQESISLNSHFKVPGEESGGLSPLAKARKAAALGGSRCTACREPERSRQLTPCHHVVCRACARRARSDETGCPVCRVQIFDDNPVIT